MTPRVADPAVGRVGAGVRDELQADPEDDRPYDEQEREQELAVRAGDPADPAGATLDRHGRLEDDPDHRDHDDRGDAERDRLLEGDQEELHGAMLADGPVPGTDLGTVPGGPKLAQKAAIRHHAYDGERDPFRSTRPVRGAPRMVGGQRMDRAPAGGDPVRAAGAGPAERRRVHPRRPRIGACQGAPRDRARDPAVRSGHRLLEPDAGGRDARLRDGGGGSRP